LAGRRPGVSPSISKGNLGLGVGRGQVQVPAAHRAHLFHGQVVARIDAVDLGQDLQAAKVAHGDQIEVAVVEDGLGADLHAPAKEAAIAHGREQQGHAARLPAVDRDVDLGIVVGQKRAHHGGQERNPSAQPLGTLIGPPGDHAGKSHRGHVEEVAGIFATVVGHEGDPAHVHLACLALAHVLRRAEELVLDAEAAAKITAGSTWDDAHFRLAPGRDQAVGHLGNRAVTAQGHDQLAASLGLLVREGARVPWRLGEARVEDAHPIGNGADHGGPAFFTEPAARARVDDDDRFFHGRGK
jgi:hypothetical protein